ncbi:MAG: HIT family protein [Gammaproteobacteria bacterium]
MNGAEPADKPCIFCHPDREILVENALARAFYDAYPVSPGHVLVVPRRHVRTLFDASEAELAACMALVRALRPRLDRALEPDGYNVGANCEVAGGQSVWHAHVHVIPRFAGDNPEPLGGVRNVIPRRRRPGD